MSATATYTVIGMTCGHCVKAVTTELRSLDAVTQVDVDLATGRVDVTSDRPLDVDVVPAAISEAGYEVAS